MHLLVADPDPTFTRLVGRVLGEAGHRVRTTADPRAALTMYLADPPDLLLVSSRFGDTDGITLVSMVRARETPARARILLVTDEHPTAVRQRLKGLAVDEILTRPLSLLDLGDRLASYGEGSSELSDGLMPRGTDRHNLAMVSRWWAAERTGVIRHDLLGGTSRWILFAGGGAVGEDAAGALTEALEGGTITLDDCEVEGEGDRAGLATELWTRARTLGDDPTVQGLEIVGGLHLAACARLPMHHGTRRILSELVVPLSVRELGQRAGRSPDALGPDLVALRAMGLLELRQGRPAAAPGPQEAPARSTYPQVRAPADRPFAAETLPEAPPTDPITNLFEANTDRRPAPVAGAAPVLARLLRELAILRTSDPWTTLGVPRGSSPELVTAAANRMRARYLGMAARPHPAIREAAEEIVAAVNTAYERIQRGGAGTHVGPAELLAAGRELCRRQDWAAADRRLAAARSMDPDSAAAMAWLGWARWNNPEEDETLRHEEGSALIDLALSYRPDDVDAHHFRAQLAAAEGDDGLAQRHLYEVFRREPDHREARMLASKLRASE